MAVYRNFSVAELDAQYDLRGVFDVESYISDWVARSAAAVERVDLQSGLSYGPTVGQKYDLALSGEGSPVFVYIHGGAWASGSRTEYTFLAESFLNRGISLVLEDYDLCPRVTVTEIIRQHRAMIAHVYQNAEQLGIDRNRIYVVGHSSGATGAAMLPYTDWEGDYDIPNDVVKGVVAISGAYDMRPRLRTSSNAIVGMDSKDALTVSPALATRAPAPVPTVLAAGKNETSEFARQGRDYAKQLAGWGIDVEYMELDRDHFDILEDLVSGPILDAALKLMTKSK